MRDLQELGFILLIIVLVIAGVQWFLVRFTHWSVALIATGFIALSISSIYVAMSHATPNGGSRGPESSAYILPFIVVFMALLFGLFVVCHLSKISIPKMAFIAPLSFIAIFFIGRYVYQFINQERMMVEWFSTCEIELKNESEGDLRVREICFKNIDDGIASTIDPLSKQIPYPTLARLANQISFRCYSTKTDREFVQEFPFDYRLCQEKEGSRLLFFFWLRQKIVLPMKIVLLPQNKVDLYIGGKLTKEYQLNESEI